MKRPVVIVFAIVLSIVMIGALLWAYNLVRRRTAESVALARLSDAALNQLRADFNAHAGSLRVILLMSPNCGTCLKGAAEVDDVLRAHPESKVAVFAVWLPEHPTSWAPPGATSRGHLTDPRVINFWDPGHRISAVLKEAAKTGHVYPQCCSDNGKMWDLMAAYAPGTTWQQAPPPPILFNGTVAQMAPKLAAQLNRGVTTSAAR